MSALDPALARWVTQADMSASNPLSLLFTHRGCFARALRDHPDEPLKSKFSQSYVAELEASKVLISILRDVREYLLSCHLS